MSLAGLEDQVRGSARQVDLLSVKERRELDKAWREIYTGPARDRKGRLKSKWVEKNALELYRAESPDEFYVVPGDWKDPAFRCRGGSLPEFGFDGIQVYPRDLTWTILFMSCDLEGGPYFARREWHKPEPA